MKKIGQSPIGARNSTSSNGSKVESNVTTTSTSTGERVKVGLQEGIGVDQIILTSREVAEVGEEEGGVEYGKNVSECVKFFLRTRITTINGIFKGKGIVNLNIVNANDSVEQIASKCGKSCTDLYKLGCYDLLYEKAVLESVTAKFFLKSLAEKYGIDVVLNGQLVSFVLGTIFLKKYGFESERAIFSSIAFTECGSDFLEVDTVEYVKELERFKDEYYFSKLRQIMDPMKKAWSKIMLFHGFARSIDEDVVANDPLRVLFEIQSYELTNMIANVNYIQVVIDCLNLVGKAKTKDNIKIAVEVCKKCLNYYVIDIPSIKLMDKRNGLDPSQYNIEHCNVKRLLEGLIERLEGVIRSVEEVVEESSRKPLSRKQKTGGQKRKGRANRQKAVAQAGSLKKAEEVKIFEDGKQESNVVLRENKVLAVDVEEVEEENFEDIERETNELMEILRGFIEGDREEKLRKKEEAKLRAAARARTTTMTATAQVGGVVQGPGIRKLSKAQRKTVRLLFENNPPHYVISRSDVESLIGALGGRVKGDGNGSKFKIFWGTSNKQAEVFEVAHGGSEADLLTSSWAVHVADAINVGISKGYIASATISDVLESEV